jgi:branched-chain amino acid transport system ATP-binding protein
VSEHNGTSPGLVVEHLSAGYSRAPVLRDLSLAVGEGQIVGVLGANGAGKTTMLRALSGVLPVCSGQVRLGGRDVARLGPWNRVKVGLAHVPEGRHVFPALTVRENLEIAALVARSRRAELLEEAFSLFPRLGERQGQLGGSLSGGEQQMLAIARALMTAPRILAVDEMSAGLAPRLVEHLVAGLAAIRNRGVGLLLVEQSPHFVADVVDHVYLLEQGRLVGSGTLDELGGVDGLAEVYLGVGAATT